MKYLTVIEIFLCMYNTYARVLYNGEILHLQSTRFSFFQEQLQAYQLIVQSFQFLGKRFSLRWN